MKKGIALLLCIVCLLTWCAPLCSALDISSEQSEYETLRENSITYSCAYDRENGKIEISGTVNHDVMIRHSEFMIEVYRILPGASIVDVFNQAGAEPLASAAIAIKFHFSVDAHRMIDRFARYAIVLISADGEKVLAAEPQYAGVQSTYQYDKKDRSGFKGIESQQTALTGGLGFGTAIVPVYLDRVLSDVSHGYLYLIDNTYRYFDQSYVDELDAKVRTYSASGAKVYLQFLLSASDTEMASVGSREAGADYEMPDVFSEDVLALVCAFSEFFAERYTDYQSGTIHGIIIGKQVDKRLMNYSNEASLQDYAERYAFYVMVVANSARFYQSDLDIVVPFSSVNVYSEEPAVVEEGDYSPSKLLEALLHYFDAVLSVPFSFNVLIESSSVPFQISKETLAEGSISMTVQASDTVSAENLQDVLRYLSTLTNRYHNAPKHLMYVWSVPQELSGSALACAYIYSYYRLLQDSEISAFVVSFLNSEAQSADNILDIQNVMRRIDTKESFEVTKNLLTYFNSSDWSRVVSGLTEEELIFRTVYPSSALQSKKEKWLGSFSYFDFSSGNVSDWFAGASCKHIKSSYGEDSMRGVSATLGNHPFTQYAEAICLYEYPENFVFTPFVKFTVALTDTSEAKDSLYELVITVGNETACLSSEYIVSGNQTTELWLDLSEYSESNMANYIKITTRVLNGDAEEYTLWLYDVTGVSDEYSSEELSGLIAAERLKIRNQSANDENSGEDRDLLWIVFGVLLAITVIGVGLYIGLRRNRFHNLEKDDDDPNEENSA